MSTSYERETEYQAIRSYLKQLDSPRSKLEEYMAIALREELTPRQHEAVRMYYLQQMRMKDIAIVMGVGISTVSRTLERARKRLSRCLKYGGQSLLEAYLESD